MTFKMDSKTEKIGLERLDSGTVCDSKNTPSEISSNCGLPSADLKKTSGYDSSVSTSRQTTLECGSSNQEPVRKNEEFVLNAEFIESKLQSAWERREEQGRFDTQGKSAVFYSGPSSSSDHRSEAVGKVRQESIHSGELALNHVRHNPETHICIDETPGGMELNTINGWLKSDVLEGSERERQEAKMKELWSDASERFARSAAIQKSSIGYVENHRPNGDYKCIERKVIGESPDHVHMTDKPLVDGKPPKEDQYLSGQLDRNGKMFQA